MAAQDPSDRRILEQLVGATQHQFAGETTEAMQMVEEAERLARAAKRPLLAHVLIQKAGWLREMGRTADARATIQEAATACDALPAQQAPVSQLKMEQGIQARRAGDLARAESLLDEAREAAEGTPIEVVVMSDILANLSTVYSDRGHTEAAQTALLRAIEYDQKTGDPRALSSNLNMLGLLYIHTGDRDTARTYLTQAKSIAMEAGLAKETADAITNLAIVSDLTGDASNARAGFMASLEAAERSGRRDDIANAKDSLGILAIREGRFGEARRFLEEAHEIHSALGSAEFTAIDLMNLAHVAMRMHDPATAVKQAREALAIAERHGLLQILWAAHYRVAHAQTAMLRSSGVDGKTAHALEDVLATYGKAADAIDLLRVGIGRPNERERLLVDKEALYQEAMMLAATLGRAKVAWTFVERARGRAFLDSLGAARAIEQAAKHPLTAKRHELTMRLLEIEDVTSGESRAVAEELRLVRSRINAEAPAVAAVTEGELPDLQAVADAVPEEAAIVEFFIGPGNTLAIFVLGNRGLANMQVVNLGGIDLAATIAEFRAEVQAGAPYAAAGQLLFAVLFGQIFSHIDKVARLLIVPHRELHYLPFSALWFETAGESPKRLYLCQRFLTSVLPSTASLVHFTQTAWAAVGGTSALVLGDPTNNLPGAALEATSVAALFDTAPLLGVNAVRDCLLKTRDRYNVIHVASHAVHDADDPLVSGVILADGRLTVEDLLDATLSTDLLTLSGCVTGLAGQHAGDELVGLSRAALAAGVPSVVTTLWNIRDDSARVFFEKFYGAIVDGMPRDVALNTAQQDMLADPQYANPVNWAPYVVIGDYR